MADIDLENLSDEEFLKLSPEQLASLSEVKSEAEETATEEAVEEPKETPAEEPAEEATADESDEEVVEEPETPAKKAEPAPEAKEQDKQEPAKAEVKAETSPVNYEAEYQKLMAPFKANGRDFQVKSVEEAQTLMQMGANYQKKMAGMKPHLATLRMLDDAKISQTDLNYLIDLHKKNPEAINKLVKDSGIDPMDLSTDKAEKYKPSNHAPTETEVELDSVLNELEGSKGYTKLLKVVGEEWDAKSRHFVSANPGVLKIINGHIENGVYDAVQAEVERERTFGRLVGLSDIDAYKATADALNEAGKFEHLKGSAKPQSQQAATAPEVIKPAPKKVEEDKRIAQKKAAAPTKGTPAKQIAADFNPLSMSDEDFKNFKF